jgi:arsenate reductase-like glutaredoxin family protein
MNEEQLQEMLNLLKEQNELIKEQTQTLRELQAFWSKIVSDEYFNEMMQSEGMKLPK